VGNVRCSFGKVIGLQMFNLGDKFITSRKELLCIRILGHAECRRYVMPCHVWHIVIVLRN
jgi:hypothetical protein